jgi:thiosulfate reductase cytochrome b subunit
VDHERRPQPWPIRITHWLNVWLLAVMAGSGLQILVAYPAMGPQGATYGWYLLEGWQPGPLLTVGQWLAGGRHWHFAFAWFFVGTGFVYLVYLFASGEWRRRLFLPRRDFANAIETAKFYLRLRRTPPKQGFYNGLQRLAYTGVVLLAALSVLTGLAIYKPLQLRPLAQLFGGYDPARAIHFLALVGLAFFTIGHVILVLLHPRAPA